MIKFFALLSLAVLGLAATARAADKGPLDHTVQDIQGKDVDLSKYKGKVVLMVNVASQCGKTPQYKGLEALYSKYKDQGLAVLGFPANEFGKQEPGTNAEISQFCTSKYGVDFPMFSKIVVKGEGIAPLYDNLTSSEKFGGPVTWNFEKFLIGRNGQVIARFKPGVEPDSKQVVDAIEAELAKK